MEGRGTCQYSSTSTILGLMLTVAGILAGDIDRCQCYGVHYKLSMVRAARAECRWRAEVRLLPAFPIGSVLYAPRDPRPSITSLVDPACLLSIAPFPPAAPYQFRDTSML